MDKKSAFVSIVGRPNVGKSSLVNAVVGQKISIVSKKPQTTRTRIMGILTCDDVQLVFIDTPGIHSPKSTLGRHMVLQASNSISDVDACVVVVEAGEKISPEEKQIIKKIENLKVPAILVINKIDLIKDKSILIDQINEFSSELNFDSVIPISAEKNDGVDLVKQELKKFAHEGGFVFPSDALTDQPERFLISEIIREKLLRLLDKEVPHGIAVQVEQMKERFKGSVDVYATIYCEKTSHKGIIIGKNGMMLKKVGTSARKDIEEFFDYKVNLQLWVKVKEDWRNRENLIMPLVYDDLNKSHI